MLKFYQKKPWGKNREMEESVMGEILIHAFADEASPMIAGQIGAMERNGLQGLGYSRIAMFAGLFELAGRAFVAFALVGPYGFDGAILANPAAWIMADALLIPAWLHTVRALQRGYVIEPGCMAG